MATQYRVAAIKLLQADLRRLETSAVGDDTISAVLTLAVHEQVLPQSPEIHPKTPMATLTNLHIYGRLGFGFHHMNALYALVARAGGLECVDELISRSLLLRYVAQI
jgi:hypothetical protein